MDNTIDQIIHYLEWYKTVYGSDIRFNGLVEYQPVSESSHTQKVKPPRPVQYRPATKGSGPDERFIHQNDPEMQLFYHQIRECQKCPLGKTRQNFVFGMGNPKADVMFVGEAPGQDEDLQGLPFVGRAGQLLDKMLFALGMQRDKVYIANVLKCRPPNNRDPLQDEVFQCEPYLKQQIQMVSPKIIIALGRISAQVLLKTTDSLSALRKATHSYEKTPFIVTYHPAALLRNPRWKAQAWEDFKKIKSYI